MNPRIVILGGGGHARVLADCLLEQDAMVIGYSAPGDEGELLPGIPYLGPDSCLREFPANELRLVNGVGSVGHNSLRRGLFERYSALGFRFLAVRHPAAVVSKRLSQGAGCQFLPGATVNSGTRLGDNVIVNSRALVEHDCKVGDHVHIASGAVLCGGCRVGENVHIGAGSVVIQGIEIGNGAIIAAGAVVIENVKPLTLVAGVPAEIKRNLAN